MTTLSLPLSSPDPVATLPSSSAVADAPVSAQTAVQTGAQEDARRDVRRWADEARALGLSRAALFLTFAEGEMAQRLADARANKTEPARPSPFIYIFQ